MDKYQKYLLERVAGYVTSNDDLTAVNGRRSIASLLNEKDELVVKQDENYNIKKHYILLGGNLIAGAELDGKSYKLIKDAPQESPYNGKALVVPVDFDNRAKELKILFEDDLADPVTLKLDFEESDHAAYDSKVEAQNRQALLEKAQIKIATGNDLVNIYFNPANDSYASAKIELYTATGQFEQHHGSVIHEGWKPRLLGGSVERLIAKYTVEEGMFFKAITGLAHGVYGVKLIQYDANNKVIVESEIEFFAIR